MASNIERAEITETSCSAERPPQRTPTRSLPLMLFVSFGLCLGDDEIHFVKLGISPVQHKYRLLPSRQLPISFRIPISNLHSEEPLP